MPSPSRDDRTIRTTIYEKTVFNNDFNLRGGKRRRRAGFSDCAESGTGSGRGSETSCSGKKDEADLLKSIDAVLSGKFDKAADYRPPLPLTQKAWSRQKTETRAGNKVFVWGRGRTFKVRLREGMGTVFKLPDWDVIDQSVLADGVNFRQKEMNNKAMLYVEALTAGADTSLTVVGRSGNIYNFYLASQGVRSETISDQVVYVDAPVPSVKSFFCDGNGLEAQGKRRKLGDFDAKRRKNVAERIEVRSDEDQTRRRNARG